MTRREAIALFGASCATLGWSSADAQTVTRQELRDLIKGFDVDYPHRDSSIRELPDHIHRMNRILKALVEEIL